MTELEPAVIAAIRARRGGDDDATAAADARLAKAFAALESTLASDDYVAGGRFTIADVVVGGVCMSARQFDVLTGTPNINAYLARLDARPAKRRAFDDGES